ncbi:MAG: Holliday junction resolvase RuvX [Woeseiaceae bacterium]|nr:Holliday junction resolvase RuvX [Woeseiaceae bacterium]
MPGTPDNAGTVLAFDFGLRRIGIAVGQQVTASASAVATVANSPRGPDWQRIDRLVREWRPARLVVGQPVTADGAATPFTDAVRAFCDALARYDLPVETVDERDTSREAAETLRAARQRGSRGRIDKAAVDAAAAALIAERWLARAELGNGGHSRVECRRHDCHRYPRRAPARE